MRGSRIQYNPSLSVRENAIRNNVSEAGIRYYIRQNGIDRRFDRKQNIIDDCIRYLKRNPQATKTELHKTTGHSLSAINRYWDYITTDKPLMCFDSRKAQKCQSGQTNKALDTHPSALKSRKPLASDLLKDAKDIILFAERSDVGRMRDWLLNNPQIPLICIGNGGKFTSYPVLMYEMMEGVAKAITPLDFASISPNAIRNSKVLLLSSAGKSIDIRYATKRAKKYNPTNTACLTFTDEDNAMVKALGIGKSFVFKNDYQDGFISIRSKILTYALLYKAFSADSDFVENLNYNGDYTYQINRDGGLPRFNQIRHYNVLYGSYGEPVARDIESTMIESGIASVQVSDYRNFCHGRFIFAGNHCQNDAVSETDVCTILLITPREAKIAEDIRERLLPANMPVVEIRTELDSPLATIQLLLDSFAFIFDMAEKHLGVNPNSPPNHSSIDKRFPINGIRFASEISDYGELHFYLKDQE